MNNDISGILLVDKPVSWTSHDVVAFVRKKFNLKKVGHCGTLDPLATGLLVLLVGRYTKFSSFFSDHNKVYRVNLLLGLETDSYDITGKILSKKDVGLISDDIIKSTLKTFIGKQKQIPPMISAKKVNGKKLYELARKGICIERKPVDIEIFDIDIKKITLPYIEFSVFSSKGCYIRTLCYDIGKKIGCGGCLSGLVREKSGPFELKDACCIDDINNWTNEELKNKFFDVNKIVSFLKF